MNWYLECWRKFADFSGRARRMELWMFFLGNIVISFVLTFLDVMVGTFDEASGAGLLSGVYSLAVIIPSLAVGARRLHDTGKSAWFLLLILVPCLGALALLVLYVLPSDEGENAYGPSPLAA